MQGTCLGNYLAVFFAARLNKLTKEFYGLCFIDPNYDPGKAILAHPAQAFYAATSKLPTAKHVIPEIDGACGMSSVQAIGNAIGLSFEYVPVKSKNLSIYKMTDSAPYDS